MIESDPWPHDTVGARALAALHEELFSFIHDEIANYQSTHPVLGPLMAGLPPAIAAKQRVDAKARIDMAFAGNWKGYAKALRDQGRLFATRAIGFADWQLLVGAWVRAMVPPLVERYAAQPKLLTEIFLSMQDLMDRAKIILGETFIQASEEMMRQRHAELERWDAIFRHVVWGIVIIDDEANIELANPAFLRLLGITDPKAAPNFRDLFAPGELVRVRANYAESAAREGRTSYEAQFQSTDGTVIPVQLEATLIPSGASQGKRWAINIIDLTERKKNERLQQRSLELEEENRRIQDASRMKSEFLANMSHELRTPLNAIIGFADLLYLKQVGDMPPTQHEFVGDILRSGRHLLRLINDVLDLSKVESGTLQFAPEAIDMRGIAAEVLSVLQPTALERDIRIEAAIDERIADVNLDPVRIKQVLYNFLSNALKFGPDHSRVQLRIGLESNFAIRIEVEDEGPGIPSDQIHRLFVQFEQLDAGSSKRYAGTGLGLALTRRLVEAQGGTVAVHSEPGRGAIFSAVLPRRGGRASLPQPRRIAALAPDAPRVLVVDDNPQDQERIVQTLVAAGYAVDTAATGAQAIRACQQQVYSAITLDLILPDASGLEVLATIRETTKNDDVPVIVISVVTDQIASGFVVHDVLSKPFDAQRLLSSMRRAGIASPVTAPILLVEDDEGSANLMIEALGSIGLRTVVARDGDEAIACADAMRPCAVILDLVLPGADGFAFLHQFRKRAEWQKIPVLVWTVIDLQPEQEELLLARAQGVLRKDGSVRDLLDTLRAHLVAKAATSPSGDGR